MDKLCLRCQSVGRPVVPGLRYVLSIAAVGALFTGSVIGVPANWILGVALFVGALTRPNVCVSCRSKEIVALDSPAAQRLLGERKQG